MPSPGGTDARPTDPARPAGRIASAAPSDPAGPAAPTDPAAPDKPAGRIAPAAPADPAKPADPGAPGKPADPVLTAEREYLRQSREYLRLMREDVLSLPALGADRVSIEYLKADLYHRAEALRDIPDAPLFFGRLDYAAGSVWSDGGDAGADGERFHVGRRVWLGRWAWRLSRWARACDITSGARAAGTRAKSLSTARRGAHLVFRPRQPPSARGHERVIMEIWPPAAGPFLHDHEPTEC